MKGGTPERTTLLVGALVLAASFGAGSYTYATFVDVETTSASIQAASDFTTSIDAVRVEPSRIEANSGGGLASSEESGDGVFTVYADVPDPESVDPSRFTLRVAGDEKSIRALRGQCKPRASGDWTCKATFSRHDLLSLGVETGSVTLVLQGWREYDRDFEGAASVEIVDAGPPSATAGAESETETERTATAEETGTAAGTDEAGGTKSTGTTDEPETTDESDVTTGTTTAAESGVPGPPTEASGATESATTEPTNTTSDGA